MKHKSIRNNDHDLNLPEQRFTLTVNSTIQQDIFKELHPSLVTFLRRKLGKPNFQVENKLQEASNSERRPYTNQEKFQTLLEKQPMLQRLVDQLGLDPDL